MKNENKRKCNDNDFINNKRGVSKIDWNKMISPSKIRNYLLKDPLLDWLQEYNITSINSIPKKSFKFNGYPKNKLKVNGLDNFTQFIMKQGVIFESKVYQYLKNKFEVVQIGEAYEARSVDKFKETINCMKKGVEIIYQGVLHDYNNNIYGCPDLLIRSDRINDIFQSKILNDKESRTNSPNLNTPYHYVIIDIKHSTLYLTSNGKYLRNSNSIPCYKGQILLYNRALGTIQGYQSNFGFVLGKKWICCKNNVITTSNDFMNKLGIIDFNNFDSNYNILVDEAIKWINNMRENGDKWSLLPTPSLQELYPNMKNEKDGNWRSLKSELNNKINEITSIWMCGVDKRKKAHKKKIFSWKNKRCTSLNLGFKKGKIYNTVNNILQINRQKKDLIRVNTLINNNNWRYTGDETMEFFIDFETINSNMGQCILSNDNVNYNSNDIIFMIGVGYSIDNIWNYKCFYIEKNNINEELNMIKNFWKFINNILLKYDKSESLFFHWSKAEKIQYEKLCKRHINQQLPKMKYFDMYDLFVKNNIVVKNSLNFSLKSIAKAMYNNKLIKSTWSNDSICSNGLNAMLLAYKLYKYKDKVSEEPIFKDIIYYNTIDCKVLWEILYYLRNNY